MICWKCKKEIKIDSIFRTSVCPICNADLHSCKNCLFFSTSSHFECKESVDEKIIDKEKSNFCDYFRVKKEDSKQDSTNDKGQKAKDMFNSLFGVIF